MAFGGKLPGPFFFYSHIKVSAIVTDRIPADTMVFYPQEDYPMKLLTDLFSTDYGLMSIIGIAMMVVAGVVFVRVLVQKVNAEPGSSDR